MPLHTPVPKVRLVIFASATDWVRKFVWEGRTLGRLLGPLHFIINKADLLDLHSLEPIYYLSDLDGEGKMPLMDPLEPCQ